MQDNYAWIVAIVTRLGVITLNIFKFVEYLKQSMYFPIMD